MRKTVVISAVLLFVGIAASVTSCRKDKEPETPTPVTPAVTFKVPAGWPQPAYNFQNNALTQQGFTLGRKLFYDVRLSRDNTVSCASCHTQFSAFSHLDHPVSHGIDGLLGKRNAPGIYNMAWKTSFFWDGGVINLENQPINPIENPVEMDEKIADVVAELKTISEYKTLFKDAFGDEEVTSQRIFKAMAQFMGVMVSSNSKYDNYVRGEAGNLSAQEIRGLELFRAKCATCHTEPLFTNNGFRNNGLSVDPAVKDSGRAHITGSADDLYKFSVPSLRNVDLTRPYMHDGRFNTLDAVLEHYRTGIVQSATLDASLKDGIAMTDDEKTDIIAFLKTLSDEAFIQDAMFSEPK